MDRQWDFSVSERKTFSYEEALELLPRVRELTEHAAREIEQITGRPSAADDFEEELAIPAEFQIDVERVLTRWATALIDLGVEVKGLWLVDFDCGSGYYCWRFPEPSLEYFHGYDEGFGGRVALN